MEDPLCGFPVIDKCTKDDRIFEEEPSNNIKDEGDRMLWMYI